MYSVVLMMAMSGGGEVPAFHRSGGGSCGCSGYVCGGGGCCRGGRVYGGGGCCHGGRVSGGGGCCHGGYACCGGGMRSAYSNGYSNGYVGAPNGLPVQDSRRATITVSVPADARIFFDDQPTTTTSSRRVFITPVLEPGQYTYNVQANLERNGKLTTQRKQVTVRPGEESQVSFEFPAAEGAPAPQPRTEAAPAPRTDSATQPRTDAPPPPQPREPSKAPLPKEKQ